MLLRTAAIAGMLVPALANAQPPQRTLLTGAEVITMEGGWTNPLRLEILIEGDRIAAIAPELKAEGAEVIDLSGLLITPGLVDGHSHMWSAIARGLGDDSAETMDALAEVWTPEASALSVELAAALAVNSGITWVNNWADNVVSPEHADAEVGAMRDSGLGGRFNYGYPHAGSHDKPMDLDDLRDTVSTWEHGPVGLGVALRGPDSSTPEVLQEEISKARGYGLPVSFHMGGSQGAAELHNVQAMSDQGMLGADVQVVHMTSAPAEDLARLAEAGSPLIVAPTTEAAMDFGAPDIGAIREAGLNMGVGVGTTGPEGAADMFTVMRLVAEAADETMGEEAINGATVFDWATRAGALAVQAPDGVGTLVKGGPADLIAISTEGLDETGKLPPDIELTRKAGPDNVRFVMIGGEIHKADGKLTKVDLEALTNEAAEMMNELQEKLGG